MSTDDFARFALVFAVMGSSSCLDLTVEEVVVSTEPVRGRSDWAGSGTYSRLVFVKLAGGNAGCLATVAMAFVAPWIWPIGGLREPLLIAAVIRSSRLPKEWRAPRSSCATGTTFGVPSSPGRWGCGSSRSRSEPRSVWCRRSSRLIAQVVATASVSAVALKAFRRWPQVPGSLGSDRWRCERSQCSRPSLRPQSLRALLPTLLVGVVAHDQDR